MLNLGQQRQDNGARIAVSVQVHQEFRKLLRHPCPVERSDHVSPLPGGHPEDAEEGSAHRRRKGEEPLAKLALDCKEITQGFGARMETAERSLAVLDDFSVPT
jgi:hypothetical protein